MKVVNGQIYGVSYTHSDLVATALRGRLSAYPLLTYYKQLT